MMLNILLSHSFYNRISFINCFIYPFFQLINIIKWGDTVKTINKLIHHHPRSNFTSTMTTHTITDNCNNLIFYICNNSSLILIFISYFTDISQCIIVHYFTPLLLALNCPQAPSISRPCSFLKVTLICNLNSSFLNISTVSLSLG